MTIGDEIFKISTSYENITVSNASQASCQALNHKQLRTPAP
jgi:hypothetical protein